MRMHSILLRLAPFLSYALVAHGDPAPELIRGPYLQNLNGHSVMVVWKTQAASKGRVQLHSSGKPWRSYRSAETSDEHAVLLTRILPNTRYHYRVISDGQRVARASFRAPSRRGKALLAVIGDSGSGSPNQYAVAERMMEYRPKMVLHTGDVVYSGYDTYDTEFFMPYRALLARSVWYPSIGNHDLATLEGYLANFYLPAATLPEHTERYYSFNYGPAHFIALDTTLDYAEGSAQHTWLLHDLESSARRRKPWTICFFHHPPFSTGRHGGSTLLQETLIPVFEAYGVQMVLSGHDHDYERFLPISLGGGHAITYIVTGGGGRSLYLQKSSDPRSAVFASRYHFLGLTISARRLIGEAIADDGEVLDRFVSRVSP